MMGSKVSHRFDLELMLAYMTICFMIAVSAFLVVPSWRNKPNFLVAAVLFGGSVAFAVDMMDVPDWLSIIAAIGATITGPVTLARWNKMSLSELIEDAKRIDEKVRGDKEEDK